MRSHPAYTLIPLAALLLLLAGKNAARAMPVDHALEGETLAASEFADTPPAPVDRVDPRADEETAPSPSLASYALDQEPGGLTFVASRDTAPGGGSGEANILHTAQHAYFHRGYGNILQNRPGLLNHQAGV